MLVSLALSLALAVPGLSTSPALRPLRIPMPPIKSLPAPPPPTIDAVSWMIWAEREDAEIGSLNPDDPRAFASITKLMTAILAVENVGLQEEATISPIAAATPIGYDGQPEVLTGEVWPIYDLLSNMLVQSGNDAAVAVAEYVGGDTATFVDLMNAKAAQLGMDHTVFVNPNGLDDPAHVSTARDLVKMGVYSLRFDDLRHMMRIKKATWTPGNRIIAATSTNRLLGRFPGYGGLKTGDTISAGQVLLSYTDTGTDGLVAAVLGSSGRRVATRELLAWGLGALGPRDRFYAAAAGTELAGAFPQWYQTRMAVPAPLAPVPRDPDDPTPLTTALDDAYRDLLPVFLGGSP